MLLKDTISKPMSRVVLGTMIINCREQDKSFTLLDAAWEAGINTIDTAAVYAGNDSERCLGLWLQKRGLREQAVIIDKGCHPNQDRQRVTPYDLTADLHDGLARLKTDYIDIYMLHRDNPDVPVGEIVDVLNQHLRAGKIKAFGGSNWTHERIAEANDYAKKNGLVPFTVSSPNFGLAEQVDNPWGAGCVTLSGPQNEAARNWYMEAGVAVFAYSSLGRGLFSGRITRDNFKEVADGACQRAYCYECNFARVDRATKLAEEKRLTVAQIALAYVLNHPLQAYALVGAASKEECQAALEASKVKLTPQELSWLENG